MRISSQLSELSASPSRSCVAIGFFDGVHLGHQQVISQMVADARIHEAASVVITFDAHPSTVVAPGRAPRLIYPLKSKLEVIAQLGVEATWLIPFNEAFSRKTGEEFIREMTDGLGPIDSLCVGGDFAFGCQRSGDVALLRRLGSELGFQVHGLAAVSLDGQTVSSTRIREMIRTGDFDRAGQMLGRAYSLGGTVVHGDGMGRQLGFPTANVSVEGLEVPPGGVYAVHLRIGSQTLRAALNIGFRPTLGSPTPRLQVEAHVLDFSGDLYGKFAEITFVAKLREEQKFPSLGALKAQIATDVATARKSFR